MKDNAKSMVKSAVKAVKSEQGAASSFSGDKPQQEAGHGSAKSEGVAGYLVPGGSKSK
jgi:hypothetical protein